MWIGGAADFLPLPFLVAAVEVELAAPLIGYGAAAVNPYLMAGALIVAQRTGRPVIALAATASRAWRLPSWDRHLVPKPFATVTIHYSAPERVRASNARDAVAEQPRFEALLQGLAPRE